MALLKLHGRAIDNFFELMGTKENDITLSLSWVLSRCPAFLNRVIQSICRVKEIDFKDVEIICQEFEKSKGFTDIEISLKKVKALQISKLRMIKISILSLKLNAVGTYPVMDSLISIRNEKVLSVQILKTNIL